MKCVRTKQQKRALHRIANLNLTCGRAAKAATSADSRTIRCRQGIEEEARDSVSLRNHLRLWIDPTTLELLSSRTWPSRPELRPCQPLGWPSGNAWSKSSRRRLAYAACVSSVHRSA